MSDILKLRPFKRFCMTVGNLPSSYVESLTYAELLYWLCDYLEKTVIPTINNNAEAVKEIQKLFEQLQDYVNNYFKNLDVQEEINNKLDEMVENGTLESIIRNTFNTMPVTDLHLKHILYKNISTSDLYNGIPHTFLQGFCVINNNILFALVDEQHRDNITRLVEINKNTGALVREIYGTFYHANSMSYKENTNEIYIAYCNSSVEGNVIANNKIGVLDYATLQLVREIEISNLGTHRIRSCYYDNIHNILYCADTFDIFEIDETNNFITNTITLDTTSIDTTITNQTYKRLKNMFVGLFVNYMSVWNLQGDLIKICKIEQIQEGLKLGELEDFDFDNDENMIIGTSHIESSRLGIRTNEFLITNLIKNYTNAGMPNWNTGADTTKITIYVDNTSTEDKEDGSQAYPFKTLQRAISYARYWNKGTSIILKGSHYDYTFIQSVHDLYIEVQENISIERLEIAYSNVDIYLTSGKVLSIEKGLRCARADVRIVGQETNYSLIKASSDNSNHAIHSLNSRLSLRHVIVDSNNIGNGLWCSLSNVFSYKCRYINYENYHAIASVETSIVNQYDNEFTVAFSNTQHNIIVNSGAMVFSRSGMKQKNNYDISTQGRIFPSYSTLEVADLENTLWGDICDIDEHYTHAIVSFIIPGTNSIYKNAIIPLLDDTGNIFIDAQWVNDERVFNSVANFEKVNGKLRLKDNRTHFVYYSNNQHTYKKIQSQEELEAVTNPVEFIRVHRVSFVIL